MTTETTVKVPTIAELQVSIAEASAKQDWVAVGKLAKALTNGQGDIEKAAKAELQKKLEAVSSGVKGIFDKVCTIMTAGTAPSKEAMQALTQSIREFVKTGKELDGADGIWFAQDFGASSTECKVMKAAKKASAGGTSRTYVTSAEKTDDLLTKYGDQPYTVAEKTMKIAGVDTMIPAGTTFKAAYDLSTNGNWRFTIRTALLKLNSTK